jgi:hypothetical protein
MSVGHITNYELGGILMSYWIVVIDGDWCSRLDDLNTSPMSNFIQS